jgi:signal transduction histidine kinase
VRIRTKIALLYTQVTFGVLLVTFAIVYGITWKQTFDGFYEDLGERALLIAEVESDRYEPDDRRFRQMQNEYRFEVNEELSYRLDADSPRLLDSLRLIIPREKYIEKILTAQTIQYESAGRQYVGIYYPREDVNRFIIVSGRDRKGMANMNNLLELLIIMLISSTLLVFFIGQFYARRVMAPVRRIIDNVKSITANNLRRSLREERGNDELSELSRTFNQMIGRLRTAFDMQNSFIRNASHELRNPLAAILGETELALNRPRSTQEYVQTLHTVLEETERLNYMMQDLLMLAQTDFDFSRIKKEKTDLVQLCGGIAEEVRRGYPEARIEILPEGSTPYVVRGAVSILRLALLNLIGNAVKFSDGNPVDIRLDETKYSHIRMEIVDRGIGIPHGELRHITQPFYRAANTAGYKGTGIGLALAKRIVELHDGRLTIESKIGEGTRVTVRLQKPPEDQN